MDQIEGRWKRSEKRQKYTRWRDDGRGVRKDRSGPDGGTMEEVDTKTGAEKAVSRQPKQSIGSMKSVRQQAISGDLKTI